MYAPSSSYSRSRRTVDFFRTEPTRAGPEPIERLNASFARRGLQTRVASSTEQQLHRLLTVERLTPARIRGYVEHPDERVVLALLDRKGLCEPRYRWYLDAALTLRCIRDMERGIQWSPTVDRVQSEADGFFWADRTTLLRWADREGLEATSLPRYRTFIEALEDIRYRVLSEDDPTLPERLLSFRERRIQAIAAARPGPVSEAAFRTAFHRHRAAYLNEISWADGLTDTQRHEALMWLMERAVRGTLADAERPMLRPVIKGLAQAGLVERERVEALVMAARVHADLHPELRSVLARDLAIHLNEEHGRWLAQSSVGSHDPDLCSLATAEETPLSLLRILAEESDVPRVREVLADRLRDHPDPSLTNALAVGASHTVRARILTHGTGPAFRKILAQADEQDGATQKALADLLHPLEQAPARGAPPRSVPSDLRPLVRELARARAARFRGGTSVRNWADALIQEAPSHAILLARLQYGTIHEPLDVRPLISSPHQPIRFLGLSAISSLTEPKGEALRPQPAPQEAVSTSSRRESGARMHPCA